MTIVDICGRMNRCFQLFPCLADPARRSSLYLKLALVAIHLVYGAVIFLFDGALIEKTKKEPWYTALYLLLLAAALILHFVTSISSPGYVLDAMAAVNKANAVYRKTSITSNQPTSSKNGSFILTADESQMERSDAGGNSVDWQKLVTDLYPPGTAIRNWTCSYCHVEQPPRSKHCHDCDKCILQFDHHCVWLGNCIGQNNHCQFWWKDAIIILLLIMLLISLIFLVLLLLFHSYLILTNQTTYELVRRRRISYLRGIPERVYPFSKGICRNLYNFCCARRSVYSLEALPSPQEIEEKSMPYTCKDVVTCRCC